MVEKSSVIPLFTILSVCRGGGYVYARTEPLHPRANSNGLYPLHRVLMENEIGRLLTPGEIVHHEDEDKSNNDLSNLRLMTNAEHARHHRETATREATVEIACPVCGKTFSILGSRWRRRVKLNRSGMAACSRRCGRKIQDSVLGREVRAFPQAP